MLLAITFGIFIAGRRSRVFLWLCLSLTAMLCINILTLTSGGRNTLGWSLGRISWMLSSSVLFLFFMRQFSSHLRFLSRAKDSLEDRVKERTADLARSLQQRDLLLREVYHRVKNNMQVIDSILFLERRRITDAPTKAMIDTLRNRVLALGLVHQQLMTSKDLIYFGLSTFIQELLQNLSTAEVVKARGIALDIRVDEVNVNLDFAIPIGLVLTELVTNSFKHANAKRISVSFQRCGDNLGILTIEDDGRDTETINGESEAKTMSTGQGSQIVAGFVRQLDGRLQVTRDDGMRVQITVPLPKSE
jgi:two-component sensor histidine kinase